MKTNVDPTSIAYINRLVASSRPFLRINQAERLDWRRVMKDPKNRRNGPWKYRAEFDVLDDKTWSQTGEVLYFVVDSHDRLKLVGQSAKRLKGRWKTVPMFDINTQAPLNMHSLFHTSAWPAMEAGFNIGSGKQFTVRAIFRNDLERECRAMGGPFLAILEIPETDLQRLSYHVEQWVCSLTDPDLCLWNKQGVIRNTKLH